MTVRTVPCRRDNYGGTRIGPVRYLVVHYTAVPDDTADAQGKYFAREYVGASAHYFVDEHEVVASVPEQSVAWHCGGRSYTHPHCRNGNAIGVEICTKRRKDGSYTFHPQALRNAQRLLRQLMAKHGIGPEQVLRHYDVTGKLCPMPFAGKGNLRWAQFKGGLTVYETLESVPSWAQATVEKLLDRGLLQGDGTSLDLSHDLVRILVILDRAGILEQEEHKC